MTTLYDDDAIEEQFNATGNPADVELEGYMKGTIFSKKVLPLVESQFKVLLELKGVLSQGRSPVDLVTVLDISGSMGGTRLVKMKLAMQFLLKKLGPTDRLSVVTFHDTAKRWCPLRQITENSRREIANIVDALQVVNSTNTEAGLKMAVEILNHRIHTDNRFVAIMLMSDGDENRTGHYKSDAANVPVGKVPVYTFGFGTNYNPEMLSVIATKSHGTFSPVTESSDLTVAFSKCLAGLLHVAIDELTLTITPDKGSKLARVNAGNYQKTEVTEFNPVTVTFRSLYDEETRKVLVTLTLPKVDAKRLGDDYVKMEYKYRAGGKNRSDVIYANVSRIPTANEAETKELVAEETRIRTASSIKASRLLADAKRLEEARKTLVDAKTSLSEVDAILKAQLDKLLLFMASQETYEKQGRAFALALEASHDSQRGGTVDSELDMFNTSIMKLYSEQAVLYNEFPNKPVAPALPKPIQPNSNDPQKIVLEMIDKIVDFMKDTAGIIKDSIV